MFSTGKFLATAAVVIAGLGSSTSWANLVVNGDFESDPMTNTGPPAGLGFDYVSSLTGWMVSGPPKGVVLFDSTYKPIGGGAQSLQLENPGNYIEQSITTVAGQVYMLTFDLDSYDVPGSTLGVEIGLAPALLFSDIVPGVYTTFSALFTAASTSTLIHFEHFGGAGTYPHLDDISVTAVPEPGSLALIGAALAGLAVTRRRKG